MDAFGYKRNADGETLFAWLLRDVDQKILMLTSKLGVFKDIFTIIGDAEMDFFGEAIPLVEKQGFVFDFNDKSQELLIRFPLSKISNLYEFRFEKLEPVLNYMLQGSGNGFCDYGYCDDEYLNLVPWVYAPEVAVKTIQAVVQREFESLDVLDSIWESKGGLAVNEIWSAAL